MSIISDFRTRTHFTLCQVVSLLLGAQAHAVSGRNEHLDHAFKLLPADVFDEITDGSSEQGQRKIVETVETQDWRLKREDPYHGVITDKTLPINSEVTVYVFFVDNDQIIKTTIQNEQNYTEHYFRTKKQGGPQRLSSTKRLKIN